MTSPRHSNITVVRPDRLQVILYALLTVTVGLGIAMIMIGGIDNRGGLIAVGVILELVAIIIGLVCAR